MPLLLQPALIRCLQASYPLRVPGIDAVAGDQFKHAMNQRTDRSLKPALIVITKIVIPRIGHKFERLLKIIGQNQAVQTQQVRHKAGRIYLLNVWRLLASRLECRAKSSSCRGPPQQVKQGAAGRGLQTVILVRIGNGSANQMQSTHRPCRRNIQQALVFMGTASGFETAQIIVGRCYLAISTARLYRCNQQMLVAIGQHDLIPAQKTALTPAGFALQAGHDDRIKLQPFGFVDGHHLQGRSGQRIGRCEEGGGLRLQVVRGQGAGRDQFIHQRKKCLDIRQLRC